MLNAQIEALDKVLESKSIACIDDSFEFVDYNGENERLIIEGVEISVYPDLLVKSTVRKNNYFGVMKIHLSKNANSDGDGGQYIATMLHQYVSLGFIDIPKGHTLRNTNFISYDVFTDAFIECPKSIKRKLDDIKAGCQNIVAIWDTI